MSIKHVAAAVITPAAITGMVLSTGAAASAAPVHRAARHPEHHSYQWVSVRPGDTLSAIAAAHHISWEALYATPPNWGHIPDPNVILAGEHLRIPKDPSMRAAQFPALEAKLQAAEVVQQPAAQAPAQQPAASQAPAQQPAESQAPALQPAESQEPAAQQPAAQQPAAQQPAAQASGGSSSTAGESAFEQCVSWRESGNNPTEPDGLFGILPSTWASLGYSGTAGQASVSQQKAAFSRLYAADGTAPWAPYDGC
jgi:LysM repeat protein